MTSAQRHEARYQRRKARREARRRELNENLFTFEEVFTFDHLYKSYKKCCLGVGWKASTQTYRANAILNVGNTYRALMAGRFKSKGFNEFDLYERGKHRHIRAVHISERVVQRCLCDYALSPMLSRSFIYDNGASMRDKGISFALNRATAHMRRYWREHGNDGYILTFDLHRYFDSIPHEPLFRLLEKTFDDKRIVELTKRFIRNFGDIGLGLGSQVSQICALAFLNGLDHLIKEKAGIRYYGRYMDDGYLIHPDKAYLEKCRKAIVRYCARLGITLNENKTQIRPLRRGFTFLKVRFTLSGDTGRIVKRSARVNISRMRRKLKIYRRWLDEKKPKFCEKDVVTSYCSWQGHMKHCDSWTSITRMDLLYQSLFGKDRAQAAAPTRQEAAKCKGS